MADSAASTVKLDPYRLRTDFPILATSNRLGKPLVYLDSAATSLKPLTVIEAVDGYNRDYSANIHRGIYEIAERATGLYEAARASTAKLINAPEAAEIVFVRNATEAINLVAYSWGRRNIGRGDTIVLTEMEHHANLVPWQILVQEKDGDLEFIPITDDGILQLEVYEALLHLRPKLVAFTHVSNMLGTINPVRQLTEMAHAAGALVLIDGAQAVPHLPVDVQAIGADFYVFSGHKMLGPTGSGALWARRELLEAMPPFLSGGDMIREVHLRRSDFNDIPYKFEAGTPDISAEIGMGAAAEYLMGLGMENIAAHERELTRYAMETLRREVPGIEIYGPDAGARGGVVAFNLPGIHPHDVAQILDRSGICVRAGHHCTMPLHERFDLAATARASFNVYTIPEEIDALAVGLCEVARIFDR
jgi:cysteine desulfurase/selenocysteine lyase